MLKWTFILILPILMMSSKNMILIWVLFEINTLVFIMLMMNNKESEQMMKYFLIQTISSIIFLLSLNMKMFSESYMNNFESFIPMLMILSLCMKMGAAPLHTWMPEITRKMKWENLFIFLSVQKIAPTFIILMNTSTMLINFFMMSCIIMGTFLQILSMNLKILLTYSSISHLSWMFMSGMFFKWMLFIYFTIYSIVLFMIIVLMNKYNNLYLLKTTNSLMLMVNLISFCGIPPLMGFLPKWMVLYLMTKINFSKLILIIFILMSCLNIFIYFRIFNMKNFNKQKKIKMTNKYEKKLYFSTMIVNISPSIYIFSPFF